MGALLGAPTLLAMCIELICAGFILFIFKQKNQETSMSLCKSSLKHFISTGKPSGLNVV